MKLQRSEFWKKTARFFTALAVVSLVLVPTVVGAQIFGTEPLPSQIDNDGIGASQTVSQLIVSVLNILLAIVGLIAVLFLVWGGFKYITSAGEEGAVDSAKKTIINALIGIVVVLLAFALVRIVANAITGGGI